MVLEYRLAYNSTCKFQHNVIFNKHENIADKVVSRRHLTLHKPRRRTFAPPADSLCKDVSESFISYLLRGHSQTTLTRRGRQVVLEMSTVYRFPLIKEFLIKCQPRLGRWSKKAKILSTQLKNAPLKSMQAMNRDLLQQQHHTDTTVLNTPSKNLQSVNVLVVHHHSTKSRVLLKSEFQDGHSNKNGN